jgi:serine/threonine protein kinase
VLRSCLNVEEPLKQCSRCGGRYSADVIFCPKDGAPLGSRKTEIEEDPYLELNVAGQFRIEQLIGIGAMGRVYRAHQTGIERDVAIKILHRDLLRNRTVISRFHREAKVASRLTHPNVVQVLMTGELERAGRDVGGEAYLVMEYLDGISLRSALAASGGAVPLPRALHVVLQVCDAVGEAHAQGVVHRDLKPENVMLVRRGDDADFVKVLDFGVARIEWADSTVATQAGVIFGTARYISPEGAQGATVGAAGDVYSITTMLFECLAGEPPFSADNPLGVLIKHTSEQAPDVRSRPRASYVPEPVARLIAANLAKQPGDRCRDARELGRALVEAARSSGLSPDDLLVRSTLLGGRALHLQSMERTRTLGLTPELAAQMAGESPGYRPGATELVDPPEPAATPERASSPDVGRPSLPSSPTQSARTSVVEPTLADEPAPEALVSGRASLPPRPSVPSLPSYDSRVSAPPLPRALSETPLWRRSFAVFLFFAVGAALTALIAQRLGAFKEPEPTVSSYAGRASAALARRAWDSPPGDNVRDITDAALRRWPRAEPIVRVRQRAARELVDKALLARADEPAQARHYAELAAELDATNDAARQLLEQFSHVDSETTSADAPSLKSGIPEPPHEAVTSRAKQRALRPSARPAPRPSAAPPPASPRTVDAGDTQAASGGRWL